MKKTIAHTCYLTNTSTLHKPPIQKIYFFMNHLASIQDISGIEYYEKKAHHHIQNLLKPLKQRFHTIFTH